jgi:hypothetical protein
VGDTVAPAGDTEVSAGETGALVDVPVCLLPTQPRAEAATTSTIKIYIAFIS